MKNIVSVFMVITMAISCFFNGFTAIADDLITKTDAVETVALTDKNKALLKKVFETETEWLASLQLENGAIPMTKTENGTVTMNPYFADFAVLALLDNAEKYSQNVKAYMDWHFSHLNTAKTDYNKLDGTIYDYDITLENGKIVKEESKSAYDSTDSYAATFLTVVNKYYETTGDKEYVIDKGNDIVRVADAMLSTLKRGLTFAKPDYEVMYLMDNCEVYEGCLSAENLFRVLTEDSSDYKLMMKKCSYAQKYIKSAIEKKMWDSEGNHYHSAVFKNAKPAYEFFWSEYYPSATAQLFPVICGVIDSDTFRAESIYNAFCDNYNWQNFDIPSEFCWGANVLAAAIMGDTDRVMEYMKNYSPGMTAHEYPLYNADIARVSMAAYVLLNAK